MQLFEFLRENRGDIQDAWVNRVLDGYAPDAAAIFKRETDRFANPVGHNARHSLTAIYAQLFDHDQPQFDQLQQTLTDFVKIRAVQDFTPAVAVGFVYDLKEVIRQAVTDHERQLTVTADDWHAFHDLLDRLALQVFDLYMNCRERLYQTRLHEYKSMNHMLTQHGCPSAPLADQTTKFMADVNSLPTHSNEAR